MDYEKYLQPNGAAKTVVKILETEFELEYLPISWRMFMDLDILLNKTKKETGNDEAAAKERSYWICERCLKSVSGYPITPEKVAKMPPHHILIFASKILECSMPTDADIKN